MVIQDLDVSLLGICNSLISRRYCFQVRVLRLPARLHHSGGRSTWQMGSEITGYKYQIASWPIHMFNWDNRATAISD